MKNRGKSLFSFKEEKLKKTRNLPIHYVDIYSAKLFSINSISVNEQKFDEELEIRNGEFRIGNSRDEFLYGPALAKNEAKLFEKIAAKAFKTLQEIYKDEESDLRNEKRNSAFHTLSNIFLKVDEVPQSIHEKSCHMLVLYKDELASIPKTPHSIEMKNNSVIATIVSRASFSAHLSDETITNLLLTYSDLPNIHEKFLFNNPALSEPLARYCFREFVERKSLLQFRNMSITSSHNANADFSYLFIDEIINSINFDEQLRSYTQQGFSYQVKTSCMRLHENHMTLPQRKEFIEQSFFDRVPKEIAESGFQRMPEYLATTSLAEILEKRNDEQTEGETVESITVDKISILCALFSSDVNEEIIDKAKEMSDIQEVRECLALSPYVSSELLEVLSKDPAPMVRNYVAMNENTSLNTLRTLCNDLDQRVRLTAYKHSSLSEQELTKMFEKANKENDVVALQGIALNPNISLSVIEHIIEHSSQLIKLSLSFNDGIPEVYKMFIDLSTQ